MMLRNIKPMEKKRLILEDFEKVGLFPQQKVSITELSQYLQRMNMKSTYDETVLQELY